MKYFSDRNSEHFLIFAKENAFDAFFIREIDLSVCKTHRKCRPTKTEEKTVFEFPGKKSFVYLDTRTNECGSMTARKDDFLP